MLLKLLKGYIFLFLCLPGFVFAQDAPDFYISNQGEDYYPGTSPLLAKKTITATKPLLIKSANIKGIVKVALQSGSVFTESLTTTYPIEMKTYVSQFGGGDFAIIDGGKEFNIGWLKEDGSSYVYQQGIPYTGFKNNDIGSNDYMYVTEVDKVLEKTAPITARRLLQFVHSLQEVEETPGSFYSPVNTTENPKLMYVHTSNGISPNNNTKYRYEVTVRDFAVNSSFQPNNIFENLWVRGGGSGYGMIPGGPNSLYNKIIFGPGAGVHYLVVRGGTVNHSLFLPAVKNANDFAVVFYDAQGFGRHCIVENSIFLDIKTPLYAHISGGTNFGAVEMDNIVGFADTTQRDAFMSTSNTDSVLLNNIYAQDFTYGYHYGSAKYVDISNSYFKDVGLGIAFGNVNPIIAKINNVFIKTNGLAYTAGITMPDNIFLQFTHSILHVYSPYQNGTSFIHGNGGTNSKIEASSNIFVCDVTPTTTLLAASTNTDNGVATSNDKWDYNVYVLLRGRNINWTVTNAGTNRGTLVVDNFEEWKNQSGQDQHSLYFDLRNDPRGLKAIFTDPDNGNYELANTPEGKEIAAMGAGMTTPLTCFLKKPTYEEAVDLIRNNSTLSFNACRNPCEKNTLRVNNTLSVKAGSSNQVMVQWNIAEQQNIDHYELQKATGSSVFKRVAIIPAREDSLYSYSDQVQPGVPYQYRLLVAAQEGNACYSEAKAIKINDDKVFTIYPNPATGKFWISLNGYLGKGGFTILNASGQPIFSKEFFSLYGPQLVDFTQQPKGIYFIRLETSEGISTQKFVIE